jgi:23S rRNA pseudouridine1911/1915/1917 synthase
VTATRLPVGADLAGSRLDAFLVRAGVAPSASAARRLLEQRAVRVDGRPGRKGQLLAAGQTVELAGVQAEEVAAVIPDPSLPLVVLYEDAALVALNKPAGWPTHPLRPGERGTLASALVARFPSCATASRDPREAGLVHRLDTGTSGVVLAARDPDSWQALRRIVGGEGCEKIYLAEVVPPPSPLALAVGEPTVVDAPIGRRGRRSGQVRVGAGRGPLPARTEIVVRQQRAHSWLVEARLHRGRAHQVRAHLGHLGLPVLGDPLYGDDGARALARSLGVDGFRLHAWRIRLVHPRTGAALDIEAPPPPWA